MYDDVLACLARVFEAGGSVYVAGNGGSHSDALHMAGELRKGFKLKRSVNAAMRETLLALDKEDGALGSAICNDMGGDYLYAQQLMGVVRPGDAFIAISTSGNSRSLCLAALTAKALGAAVIAFTGKSGGRLHTLADCVLAADVDETYLVQEQHLRLYHRLCMELERRFFSANE
jgi:D-sedoheptulose 7-phosphate isomerase